MMHFSNRGKAMDIKNLIFNIRGMQVLLDSDVAMLYGYETKQINKTVSRNKARFPESFRFQLIADETEYISNLRLQNVISKNDESENDSALQPATLNEDVSILRFQNGTSKHDPRGGRRYRPYVFTEQGIAMLSGLLKSDIAVQVSIGIMQAFVEMRRFITAYGNTFERISTVEYKLLEHDKKFDELFDYIQSPQEFSQGIFYSGQIYDAFKLIMDIIHSAEKSIIIIDNYIDDSVLDMLTIKKENVAVAIVTGMRSHISKLAISKFEAQYSDLNVTKSNEFHDRFIIIDESKLYHVGASLKDAGKTPDSFPSGVYIRRRILL